MARWARKMARRDGYVRNGLVATECVCDRCGETVVHMETWYGDSTPQGLPEELARCDCGGTRVPKWPFA